jgi:uncharacterized membrane protein
VFAGPTVIAVLLWSIIALRFQPPLDFLLAFALVLIGTALFAHMLLRWMADRSSSAVALASCAAGIMIACSGGVNLAYQSPGPGTPVKVIVQLLAAVSVAVLVRVQRREKDNEP